MLFKTFYGMGSAMMMMMMMQGVWPWLLGLPQVLMVLVLWLQKVALELLMVQRVVRWWVCWLVLLRLCL